MKRIYIAFFVALALLAGFLLAIMLSAGTALSEADNGRQVGLAKGQTISISLSANPSTGYTWEVSELDTSVLRQVGQPEFLPSSALIGAGGTMMMRFQAVGAGQTTLKLVYHRPWENKTEPAQTFSIRVVVR